jgi:endonuclease/exonuclease/phosphatase family metal-dependent hydrolase
MTNNEEINKELNKLPKHIRDKIRINPELNGLIESDFHKHIINNPEIQQLEKSLKQGGVDDISLYDMGVKRNVNGFNCIVLEPGIKIYKTIPGFATEEQIYQYCESSNNLPSWWGNKYIAYAYSRSIWSCMVVYDIVKEIVLIDMFDEHNIYKLIELLNEQNMFACIQYLHYSNGYKITLSKQIMHMHDISDMNNIWVFDRIFNPKNTFMYRNINNVNNLNPLVAYRDYHINIIFRKILCNMRSIDGFIKQQIKSTVDIFGAYLLEEIILKSISINQKCKFNRDDKLCWVNWTLKDVVKNKYAGIISSIRISRLYDIKQLHINNNFELLKFYISNNSKLLQLRECKHILSYNVHSFKNLNVCIERDDNIKLIIDVIYNCSKKLELIILQEVKFYEHQKKIYDMFSNAGFKYIYTCANGSPLETFVNNMYIMVLSKTDIQCQQIDCTIDTYDYFENLIEYKKHQITNRNMLLMHTKYGKICSVHLEIGIPELYIWNSKSISDNELLKKNNSTIRIDQLKKIVTYDPDIIIGDFNFTIHDPEYKYMIKNNYICNNSNNEKSTIWNRVDHCFSKKAMSKNELIQCNYSDHLPLLQPIK